MKRRLLPLMVLLGSCGASQNLVLYDALDTTNTYDCGGDPKPDPIHLVVALDESGGVFHLYTCDDHCDPVKVEVATSTDGTHYTGGVNAPPDARGCSVHEDLTATVDASGNTVTITEHSVTNVSQGCDKPGICTQDATITGTKK
jgi:hypothetical protein